MKGADGKVYKQVSENQESQHSRTAEMILGIMGGVFGIIAGVFSFLMGGFDSAINNTSSSSLFGLGFGCVVASIVAIILVCMINKNRVVMGWLIIVCGILNIVFVSAFGVLSGVLIIVAGILALIRK
ncbi:membrane protein [Latilactobacillus sakei]|nr:membrane protein [Latilactobacillus sakei]